MMDTPKRLAKAGGEDEQPDQRSDEGREKALALMQEAQHLAPHDAAEADEIARSVKTPWCSVGGHAASGGDAHERAAQIVGLRGLEQVRHGAGEANAPLVQQHDMVVAGDLIDQVRGPEHAHAPLLDEGAHDGEHALARGDIEADSRLVQHKAGRIVQQRPGDFDAPRLATGQRPRFVVGTFRKADLRERIDRPAVALAPADALQGGMIGEVLQHAQIAVETAALEYDTKLLQRCGRVAGARRGPECGSRR